MNLISPLGIKQSDLDIITSPEQASTITACSYGDMISDTEAFDSITPKNSFQQHPFHNSMFFFLIITSPQKNSLGYLTSTICFLILLLIGQYIGFTGNNRSAYNMDHSLLSADDVQSPYPNSCNVQQSFHNLPEASDCLQNKSNNQDSFQPQIHSEHHFGLETSSDSFSIKVVNSYIMYKVMPEDLRKEISFQNYMHAAECHENLCKCHLYLELSSHFDKCYEKNCNICGPARSLCGSTGNLQLESRKRKLDQSETTDDMGPASTGTLLDALPTKFPKSESSTVGEDATNDDQRRKVNGVHDQQVLTVVNQSDDIVNNEVLKAPQLCSEHLASKEITIDEEEKSGQVIIEASNDLTSSADVAAELNSNKSVTQNVSMVDCNSVLESDNSKIKITSLTDNDSQLEPEKIKIQSVSLADFFTADQIKEHLLSFTSQKVCSL